MPAGEAARGEAFKLLFAYIAGANRVGPDGKDRVAMTVPVEMRNKAQARREAPYPASATNGAMLFSLPAKYKWDNAPKPTDPRVRLVAVPAQIIAILRFSGSGGDSEKRQGELVAMLAGSKWRPIGQPFTLFYDAPFTLPFLRRTEAAVEVEQAS